MIGASILYFRQHLHVSHCACGEALAWGKAVEGGRVGKVTLSRVASYSGDTPHDQGGHQTAHWVPGTMPHGFRIPTEGTSWQNGALGSRHYAHVANSEGPLPSPAGAITTQMLPLARYYIILASAPKERAWGHPSPQELPLHCCHGFAKKPTCRGHANRKPE